MKRCIGSLILFLAIIGCGRGSLNGLSDPEQLTLFSIDGRDEPQRGEAKAKESFHGYPVLGKIEITDPAQRRALLAALHDAIARNDGRMAFCFWPRHGIRAVEKGKTI